MRPFPLAPGDPVPFIRLSKDGCVFAWCCSKYGLDCLGNSRAEALTAWREAYKFERENGGRWLSRTASPWSEA
jgi:hypothetical protein